MAFRSENRTLPERLGRIERRLRALERIATAAVSSLSARLPLQITDDEITFEVGGEANGSRFLRDDFTWADPPSSGGGSTPFDGTPSALAPLATPGTSSEYARGDHVHPLPTAAEIGAATSAMVPGPYPSNPEAPGTASAGAVSEYARGDHVHPAQAASGVAASDSGLLVVTGFTTVQGAIAATDAAIVAATSAASTDATTKANAAQSTAISTAASDATTKADAAQAFAIQRANHTGVQAISTVTGLQTALDAKMDSAVDAVLPFKQQKPTTSTLWFIPGGLIGATAVGAALNQNRNYYEFWTVDEEMTVVPAIGWTAAGAAGTGARLWICTPDANWQPASVFHDCGFITTDTGTDSYGEWPAVVLPRGRYTVMFVTNSATTYKPHNLITSGAGQWISLTQTANRIMIPASGGVNSGSVSATNLTAFTLTTSGSTVGHRIVVRRTA